MRKDYSDFQMNYTSETGSMTKNNSVFDFVELDNFACWVAADINPEADKEIVNIIVNSILRDFRNNPTIVQQEIKKYIVAARELVADMCSSPVKVGLAIGVTDYMKMLCIATGNERIYHLQRMFEPNPDLKPVLELGVAAEEEKARFNNFAAENEMFGLFISKTITLHDGDVIFIGNSGFWKYLSEQELFNALPDANEPFMYLYKLKQLLVQRRDESLLSYTIVAIFVNQVYKNSLFKVLQTMVIVAMLAGLAIGLFVFKPFAKSKGVSHEASGVTKIVRRVLTEPNGFMAYEKQGDRLVKDGMYQKALAEYRKAINCKDLKRNQAREALQDKMAVTRMVIAADKLAATGRYQSALTKYGAAQKAALQFNTYERSGLQKRIATVQVKLTVSELVAKGDRAIDQEKYQEALVKYTSAKALAGKVMDKSTVLRLERKITNTEARLAKQHEEAVNVTKQQQEEERLRQMEKFQAEKEQKEAEAQRRLEVFRAGDEDNEREKQRQNEKLQAENEKKEQEMQRLQEKSPDQLDDKDKEQFEQQATPQASAQSRLEVYKYTVKVEPPNGFSEGNSKARMADFCSVVDDALVMNTMAHPQAGPSYKIGLPVINDQVELKFTVVVRAKACAEYGMDFDFHGAGVRERIRLLYNCIKLDSAGNKSRFFRAMEWHTYCITFEVSKDRGAAKLFTKVFIDGNSRPAVQGISTAADSNNYFRFGDTSGSSGYIGALKWIVWSFEDAYSPDRISLPSGFAF